MILAKTDGVLSRCFSGTWSQLILTVILNVTETTISPLCTWGNRQGDVRWFAEVTQLVAEHGFEPRQFGCRTQALNQPHCTASLCFSCALRSERPGISWQLGTLRPEALMPTVAKLSGDRVGQETSPSFIPYSWRHSNAFRMFSLNPWDILSPFTVNGESALGSSLGKSLRDRGPGMSICLRVFLTLRSCASRHCSLSKCYHRITSVQKRTFWVASLEINYKSYSILPLIFGYYHNEKCIKSWNVKLE